MPKRKVAMQLETTTNLPRLNLSVLDRSARDLLEDVLNGNILGRTALVSSFGAESAVLLHLASRVDPDVPVIFLDTHFLFAETLEYQLELTRAFGLNNVHRITPDRNSLLNEDAGDDLHQRDTDACCNLRKTRPLLKALEGYGAWITGRKRFQTEARKNTRIYEPDTLTGKVKINPLAYWEPQDLKSYFERHQLPRHPMVARGYPSVGCWPCTTSVDSDQDMRAGRWANSEKTECGIHIDGGQVVRSAA